MEDNGLKFLHIGEGAARRGLAVRAQAGAAPGLVWLGGYKSDMKGTKAVALADWAAQQGRACVRFDYSGHGESEGAFTDGTIGRWLADSLAVFDASCRGPQILIGSSMGGWLALLMAREETGVWARPSQYSDEPYLVTRQLIEEGRNHLLLGNMIETGCPVRILQGVEDPDVPWRHAVELTSRLASDDVVLTLVKDGDHRLSRPEDIERMLAAVAEF
jgi:pimeloyl-ACP methyl ester carboxylesterase